MEINVGQTTWLRYNLRYTATGDPRYGLTANQIWLWYSLGATADWTPAGHPVGADFHEHSLGAYAIKFDGAILATTGPFYSMIADAEGTPWTAQASREDIIVPGDAPGLGYVVTVSVTQNDGTPVPCIGASVQVRDSTGLTILTQGVTDGNGEIVFTLAAGTYKLYVWKAGVTFSTSPVTVVIAADITHYIEGVSFLPAAPDAPNLSLVYGTLIDVSGTARAGVVVKFDLIDGSSMTHATDNVVSSVQKTATTDANGQFAINLIPNGLIEPAGTKYRATVADVPRQTSIFTLTGNGSESFDISDLIA